MKVTTECEIPKELLHAISRLVVDDGIAYMRVRFKDGLYEMEVLGLADVHCSTCQCNRVHCEMPNHPVEPNVKRTKSWHHG